MNAIIIIIIIIIISYCVLWRRPDKNMLNIFGPWVRTSVYSLGPPEDRSSCTGKLL